LSLTSAMSKLPDSLKRRDTLYGRNTPAELLSEFGDLYFQEGRLNDAVAFFGRAGDHKGLRRIHQKAMEQGDFFLFSRAMEFLQEEVSLEDWQRLGTQALGTGKYLFALKCFEKIGDREGIRDAKERLRQIIPDEEAS
jgi:tetratricopeptide (TPR) repeat protein